MTETSVSSQLKATSVSSQLKAALKENLLGTCRELEIDVDPKDTRAAMQTKINEFSQLNGENERKVREQISKIKSTHKERASSQSNTHETADHPNPTPHNDTNKMDIDETTESAPSMEQTETPPQHTYTPSFEDSTEQKQKNRNENMNKRKEMKKPS